MKNKNYVNAISKKRTMAVFAVMALGAGLLAASHEPAAAVSSAVRRACMSDYFAYCSAHAVGSPGLRQCMRAVGPRLSPGCIDALVDAGEVAAPRRRSAGMR